MVLTVREARLLEEKQQRIARLQASRRCGAAMGAEAARSYREQKERQQALVVEELRAMWLQERGEARMRRPPGDAR